MKTANALLESVCECLHDRRETIQTYLDWIPPARNQFFFKEKVSQIKKLGSLHLFVQQRTHDVFDTGKQCVTLDLYLQPEIFAMHFQGRISFVTHSTPCKKERLDGLECITNFILKAVNRIKKHECPPSFPVLPA